MPQYWFTIHWPHPVDIADDFPWYVYLQHHRKSDGLRLAIGDKVAFYETGGRRQHLKEGTKLPVELKRGAQGVVCVAQVENPLRSRSNQRTVYEYTDGKKLNWAWEVPCDHHEWGTIVAYKDVLAILGRKGVRIPGGLIEIERSQYEEFRRKMGLRGMKC